MELAKTSHELHDALFVLLAQVLTARQFAQLVEEGEASASGFTLDFLKDKVDYLV